MIVANLCLLSLYVEFVCFIVFVNIVHVLGFIVVLFDVVLLFCLYFGLSLVRCGFDYRCVVFYGVDFVLFVDFMFVLLVGFVLTLTALVLGD